MKQFLQNSIFFSENLGKVPQNRGEVPENPREVPSKSREVCFENLGKYGGIL